MKRSPVFVGIMVVGIVLVTFLLSVFVVTRITGGSSTVFGVGSKIAVVNIKGLVDESKTVIDQLVRFRKDRSVEAIVLRIDSPGGGVGASQEIYAEIIKIKDNKKVIVSMGSVATSGGYYIACAADKIVANPGTITGSIGVILEYTNVKELMDKVGFKDVIIKSGKYKDAMSSHRDITDEERSMLQGVIDNVHNQFIEAIAKGRGLKREYVANIADGRIFSGEQAKELGLIDVLGNLQDAISIAAEIVDIKGEPRVIYPPKERRSLLEFLLQGISREFISYLRDESCGFNLLSVPISIRG